MPSPAVLDFERLLAPIPGDNSSGINLRNDPSPVSDYILLKDAHLRARNLEREQETASTSGGAMQKEWRSVLARAEQLLAAKSKDMEIAAWMIEILGRIHGFAGLRDGFRLVTGLVQRYWDDLHSVLEDDGMADRTAPLTSLNGSGSEGPLPSVIRRIPITGEMGDGPFASWQYEQAKRPSLSADEQKRSQDQLQKQDMLDRMAGTAKACGVTYYRNLIDDIEACLESFEEMQSAVEKRSGGPEYSPSSTKIRDALTQVLDIVRDLTRDLPLQIAPPHADAGPVAGGGESPAWATLGVISPTVHPGDQVMVSGPIRAREDAFRTLLMVADFFRQSEPHSPISYTLEELVRRGRMPLPELLKELIPDDGARRTYLQFSGISLPPVE
jgi:type VI secretion system protein ImpA